MEHTFILNIEARAATTRWTVVRVERLPEEAWPIRQSVGDVLRGALATAANRSRRRQMTKVFVAEFDSVVAIARILAPLCAADYARPDGCFRIPDPIAGYAGGDVGFMWPRDRILAFPASVASHYVTPPADTELH